MAGFEATFLDVVSGLTAGRDDRSRATWHSSVKRTKGRELQYSILVFAVLVVFLGFIYPMFTEKNRLEGVEVLAMIAEGSDYTEYTGVKSFLEGEGAIVTTASFETGTVVGDGGSFKAEITFDQVDASHYDVFLIPGGDGPHNMIYNEKNQLVYNILIQADEEGKLLAAICHGPWVLAAANLVNGCSVTCYPVDRVMIQYIVDAGASVNTDKLVVRDGRIITGNSWDAITPFSREILEALLGK